MAGVAAVPETPPVAVNITGDWSFQVTVSCDIPGESFNSSVNATGTSISGLFLDGFHKHISTVRMKIYGQKRVFVYEMTIPSVMFDVRPKANK